MVDPMTPAALAKSLTKAQREAVITLTEVMAIPECRTVSSNAYKSLDDAWGGILVVSEWRLNPWKRPPHRKAYRLNSSGLAVRAHLMEQEGHE